MKRHENTIININWLVSVKELNLMIDASDEDDADLNLNG